MIEREMRMKNLRKRGREGGKERKVMRERERDREGNNNEVR